MVGEAISDESMESILSSFDNIYDEFKLGISEIESLRSKCNMEIEKREALQITVQSLQSENKRVSKLYTELLNNLADQFENRVSCQSLREELKRVNDEHMKKESEYRKAIESLKEDYTTRIKELEFKNREFEAQKTGNEGIIKNLQQDLTVHKNHIQSLSTRLEKVYIEVESKYEYEIQDLKDCLSIEQEEKNELNKKVQELEKAVLRSRTELVEQQQDMTCSRHVETLKQKIMKLRKENEVLKRKLLD